MERGREGGPVREFLETWLPGFFTPGPDVAWDVLLDKHVRTAETNLFSVCVGCGSIGISCCESAMERLQTASSLRHLVDRQSAAIARLEKIVSDR